MSYYKKEVLDIIKERIFDQMWFDYVKLTYPNDLTTVCGQIVEAFDTDAINPLDYVRFIEVMHTLGADGMVFLKGSIDYDRALEMPIDLDSLSEEETIYLDYIIWSCPKLQGREFILTDELVKELNKKRGIAMEGVQRG